LTLRAGDPALPPAASHLEGGAVENLDPPNGAGCIGTPMLLGKLGAANRSQAIGHYLGVDSGKRE
jgi:hypothetical protein